MNGTESATRSRVAAEAAEWLVVMQENSLSSRQRARFAEWLAQSAEHVHEYLRSASLWRDLGVGSLGREALGNLIEEAKRDAANGNVVALEARGPAERVGGEVRLPRWGIALAASLAMALVSGLAWKVAVPRWYGQSYQTDIGEQTSFTLTDGSVVRLNTRSKLRVRMTASARDIELVRGEALFEVAKDPGCPFRVSAGATTVRVLGTVFNVYRRASDATVTVIEGKVQVASATAAVPEVLEPKEQAKVSRAGAITTARDVNLDQVTAWKDRRLVFTGSTLDAVAAEFNRYNTLQLRVADAELARIRINAVFSASDPASLVEFLKRTEEVAVRSEEDGVEALYRLPSTR